MEFAIHRAKQITFYKFSCSVNCPYIIISIITSADIIFSGISTIIIFINSYYVCIILMIKLPVLLSQIYCC